MTERWKLLDSEFKGDFEVFEVRRKRARSPRTERAHHFHVIEAPDWINVIPLTPEGLIVGIRQYRHGTEEVTLEIPGGVIDPGDASPAVAARREMIEETGYDAEELVPLGHVAPNPALQDNRCYTFLARNARPVREQALDGAEEIEVVLIDPDEVPALITGGEITHALVVAAFYLFDQYRLKDRRPQTADR